MRARSGFEDSYKDIILQSDLKQAIDNLSPDVVFVLLKEA
jgi:SpoU rRNA methylase family enzyme